MLSFLRFAARCLCMAPLPPIKMVIMRFTFHPLCFDVSINGSDLLRLFLTIVFGYWS